MSDQTEGVSQRVSGAASSLRDTTKWLVGGVAITAAGVFAGSPLTTIGNLSPSENLTRLLLAIAGAAVGFASLGWILRHAIQVLTLESVTFRMLAQAEQSKNRQDLQLRLVAQAICEKHKHSFPIRKPTLYAFVQAIDKLPESDPLREEAREFAKFIMADAQFLLVRRSFGRLTSVLIPATALAAVGFGTFAWAANPPSPPTGAPMLVLNRP